MARQSFRSWLFGGFYLGLIAAIENEARYTRNHVTAQLHEMERRMTTKLEDLSNTLDDISTRVDEQATILAEQGKVQAEIGLDVDDLLSLAAGGDLTAVVDKATALKDKMAASNAALSAATDALKAIAAKHVNPTEGTV